MIITCVSCSTRFRLPDDRISDAGTKVRCSKCNHVFKVRPGDGEPDRPKGSSKSSSGAEDNPPAPVRDPFALNKPEAEPGPAPTNPLFSAADSGDDEALEAPTVMAPSPLAGLRGGLGSRRGPDPISGFGAPVLDEAPPPSTKPPPAPLFADDDHNEEEANRPTMIAPSPLYGLEGVARPKAPPPPPVEIPRMPPPPPPPPTARPLPPPPPPELPPAFDAPVGSKPGADSYGASYASDPFTGVTHDDSEPFGGGGLEVGPPDPFAGFGRPPSSVSGGVDPFGGPPPPPSDDDPFGAAAGAGDPFARAGGDPFASAGAIDDDADPFAAYTEPPGGDPFGLQVGAPPMPAGFDGGGDPFGQAARNGPSMPPPPADEHDLDPFAGMHATAPSLDGEGWGSTNLDGDVDDHDDMPATRVASIADNIPAMAIAPKSEPRVLRPEKKVEKKPSSLAILSRVAGPAAFVAQAVLLVVFLAVAVVWARGGNFEAALAGRFGEALFGAPDATASSEGLRAVDVVVSRRPVTADPSLVVVSGRVENTSELDLDQVQVEVQFDNGQAFVGWVGAELNALDLGAAKDTSEVERLAARPANPGLKRGESRDFVVVASGLPDGAHATVRVRTAPAGAPTGEAPSAETRSADEG